MGHCVETVGILMGQRTFVMGQLDTDKEQCNIVVGQLQNREPPY